jgi:hypothetical protein
MCRLHNGFEMRYLSAQNAGVFSAHVHFRAMKAHLFNKWRYVARLSSLLTAPGCTRGYQHCTPIGVNAKKNYPIFAGH